MAKLRKEDILQLSVEDLRIKIVEDQELIRKYRFNHAITPLDNPLLLRMYRRQVAKLKTELRKREMSATASQTENAVQA